MHYTLFVIPSDVPWNWSTTDYVNQTAKLLSKKNIVICFFWINIISFYDIIFFRIPLHRVFKKYSKNLYHFTYIHILPFRRFIVIEKANYLINYYLLKSIIAVIGYRKKFDRKVLWVFHPSFAYLFTYFASNFITVFDCVDYFIGNSMNTHKKKQLIDNTRFLLEQSDKVFVNSHSLYKLYQPIRKDIKIVPQGFRLYTFNRIQKHMNSYISIRKPIIGYIGGINYRLDYKLIIELVKKNQQYMFVFVGPLLKESNYIMIQKYFKHIRTYPNVIHVPSIGKNYIPDMIKKFDIGMIPYDISLDFNKYCYPMKLFEYFYMGKPVIATPIVELRRFPNYVKIGRTPDEWEKHIQILLAKPWPKIYQNEEMQYAVDNSWEKKIDQILNQL